MTTTVEAPRAFNREMYVNRPDNVFYGTDDGAQDGSFTVEDPDYMANVLWTQVLGATHLARIRVGVRQAAPGIPELFTVAPEQIARTCVASALATVGVARPR